MVKSLNPAPMTRSHFFVTLPSWLLDGVIGFSIFCTWVASPLMLLSYAWFTYEETESSRKKKRTVFIVVLFSYMLKVLSRIPSFPCTVAHVVLCFSPFANIFIRTHDEAVVIAFVSYKHGNKKNRWWFLKVKPSNAAMQLMLFELVIDFCVLSVNWIVYGYLRSFLLIFVNDVVLKWSSFVWLELCQGVLKCGGGIKNPWCTSNLFCWQVWLPLTAILLIATICI